MVYPCIDQLEEDDAQAPFLLRIYPCFYAQISVCFFAVSTSVIALLFIIKTCSGEGVVECSPGLIRLVGLVPLGFLLAVLHHRFNNMYVLGDTNISRLDGRLSFSFRNPSIRYTDIRGVTVHQSFWGRILDFGSVELGTAASDGNELILHQIKAPYELAELIEGLRRRNLAKDD